MRSSGHWQRPRRQTLPPVQMSVAEHAAPGLPTASRWTSTGQTTRIVSAAHTGRVGRPSPSRTDIGCARIDCDRRTLEPTSSSCDNLRSETLHVKVGNAPTTALDEDHAHTRSPHQRSASAHGYSHTMHVSRARRRDADAVARHLSRAAAADAAEAETLAHARLAARARLTGERWNTCCRRRSVTHRSQTCTFG